MLSSPIMQFLSLFDAFCGFFSYHFCSSMADFRVSFRYKSILSVFSLHLMHFQIVLPIDGDLGFLVDGRVFYLSSWSLASFDAFLWFFPFYFIHRNGIRLRSVLYVLLEIIRASGDFLFFLVICRSDVAIWFFVSILVKKKKNGVLVIYIYRFVG